MEAKLFISMLLFYLSIIANNTYSMKLEEINIKIKEEKSTPKMLHVAIIKENNKLVKELLENGVDPNAYIKTNAKCFKSISKKYNVNFFEKALIPPIVLATGKSNIEIIKLLIEHGANIHKTIKVKDKYKDKLIDLKVTAIFFATHNKLEKIAKFLDEKAKIKFLKI